MTPDADGLPLVGRSARQLGIRLGRDVVPNDQGFVVPGGGGMSVATGSHWNLPAHRRPRMMGRGSSGNPSDCVYRVALPFEVRFALEVREDDPEKHHALVEPGVPMTVSSFEGALAETRSAWQRVWP
jgi:hypothetical protein